MISAPLVSVSSVRVSRHVTVILSFLSLFLAPPDPVSFTFPLHIPPARMLLADASLGATPVSAKAVRIGRTQSAVRCMEPPQRVCFFDAA